MYIFETFSVPHQLSIILKTGNILLIKKLKSKVSSRLKMYEIYLKFLCLILAKMSNAMWGILLTTDEAEVNHWQAVS